MTRGRLAALLVLAALAAAPSAHARVVAIAQEHDFSDLAVAEGAAFYLDNGLFRIDLETGARTLVLRQHDDLITQLRAGGDRVAVTLSNTCSNAPCRTRVLSFDTHGNQPTEHAVGDRGAPGCPSEAYLADVTSAGAVVVDEMDCHSRPDRYPGTLYSYLHGERRVYGRDHVFAPQDLSYTSAIWATGHRYVTWTRRDGRDRVFLVDPLLRTTRRLAKNFNYISGVDLNDRSQAVVAGQIVRRDRGYQAARLYLHDGRTRRFVAQRGISVEARLCGLKFVRLESGNGRYRLLVSEPLGAPPRVVFDRPLKADLIVNAAACDAKTFAFSAFTANPGGNSRYRLHAYSLDP